MLRVKTDLKMARTGGYRRSAVWRPCGVRPHAALQNKSVVCSGSQVTISTIMKFGWSVKRGGIIVKRIQRALAHIYIYNIIYISQADWAGLKKAPRWAKIGSKKFPTQDMLGLCYILSLSLTQRERERGACVWPVLCCHVCRNVVTNISMNVWMASTECCCLCQ